MNFMMSVYCCAAMIIIEPFANTFISDSISKYSQITDLSRSYNFVCPILSTKRERCIFRPLGVRCEASLGGNMSIIFEIRNAKLTTMAATCNQF